MHTFTLPSEPEVGMVQMTGVEEDLLTNQRLIKADEAVKQVLASRIKHAGAREVLCRGAVRDRKPSRTAAEAR